MSRFYDSSYDEDAYCDAIERYRRPDETFEQCEARLLREAEDERRGDICMYEWEL